MAKFLVYAQQTGYGCDYTIGCGLKVEFIDAPDMAAALQQAERLWYGPVDNYEGGRVHSEVQLQKLTVCEVPHVQEVNVQAARGRWQARKDAAVREAKEAKDRAQYEALKAKFEGRG